MIKPYMTAEQRLIAKLGVEISLLLDRVEELESRLASLELRNARLGVDPRLDPR